jgi:hypothetical protein
MMGGSSMIPPVPGGSGGGNNLYFLQQQQQLFHAHQLEGIVMDDGGGGAFIEPDTHSHALLYNLSVLKDKVQQLQPLVRLAVAHDGPVAAASSGASAVIQEIISAASSMMYAFQQLYWYTPADQQQLVGGGGHYRPENNNSGDQQIQADVTMMPHQQQRQSLQHQQQQYGGDKQQTTAAASTSSSTTIIELDAGELLAKYTHYCQVCSKGFKRDANLRMHMRAHGDEYKSSAALMANKQPALTTAMKSYYSCPQEGCRWNRKHAKFQPLKSVICAKNHYKRSHCPKMYVCNRCNLKHFSVLSDLRTHEKHCGDHRWLCSCGTSFSRKDKLIGHLALFAGHHPAVPLDTANNGKTRSSSSSSITQHHGSSIYNDN